MEYSYKSFILFVVIALIILSNGIVYTVNKLWHVDQQIQKVTDVQIDMLTCRRNEKDFIARLDTVYVDRALRKSFWITVQKLLLFPIVRRMVFLHDLL